MDVPITQFRREIFSLVNQALDGSEVWITHRGRRLKIVPEGWPASRLSRIAPMEILNPEALNGTSSAGDAGVRAETKTETMAEMKKAWESDWFVL
jgi:antitoxin (DNA-binding transcriptional repressor) of toxin-antitoxin stability system